MLHRSVIAGGVGGEQAHDSACKHAGGNAVYVDDREPAGRQLYAAVGSSNIARGRLVRLDLSDVASAAGVVAVITAADVPGNPDIGPVHPGDPVLVDKDIEFYGQALFAVAATRHDLARKAVARAIVEYDELEPVVALRQAVRDKSYVRPPHVQQRGDAPGAIETARHRLEGELTAGGQEHFYLEGQVSCAEPTEDGGMRIHTSSQHPSEVGLLVARVLNLPINRVTVQVRRMGGGFGGKETNAAQWACLAALLASRTGRPVNLRLSRGDDMLMTGKRHPFYNRYRVGFDGRGLIQGIEMTLNGDAGFSADLTDAVVDRAMFHADNAYYLGNATITGNRCKTNKVSNTAFRGFGGPQGLITIEAVMDRIARTLGKDPLTVRKQNLYGKTERNITHYHQKFDNNNLLELIERLERSANYWSRRESVTAFNDKNRIVKKGLALTPVKFGISFTVKHLNQAGALIHVYSDGSIHLNQGGTEMGQGLFTKVAQIVAEEFQVDIDRIQVSSTRTDKVPNTSPTAASAGTDLNGQAAREAAGKIKRRLIAFAARHFEAQPERIRFENNKVYVAGTAMQFGELAKLAYLHRVQLSATGFYRTPDIYYDRDTGTGRPFFYFAQGAAAAEVLIDTLTGENRVLRVDILQDVGKSINPAIDIGQIEGGFIQGMGWLTTEELKWDEQGRPLALSPATYKIPAIGDTPAEFNVELLPDSVNEAATIYHSKAVGEPPLMLAVSVWSALADAVASVADYRYCPRLDPPATPERILSAVEDIERRTTNRESAS